MRSFGELLPEVRVPPPGPRSKRLSEELARVESPAVSTISAGHIPIFWRYAAGANILDADGNRYIDLTAGFGVAAVGHSNPKVLNAMQAQASRLLHGLGDVHPNEPRASLALRLTELFPGGSAKAIISNTGAESVELALKTATLHTGRYGFVAFEGGFHGQTYGALQVTSAPSFREPFLPQLHRGVAHAPYPYCYRCPIGLEYPSCGVACLDKVDRLLDGYPAAVIVEPVLGRGGEVVPPPDFLPRLKSICASHGVLLIVDEMFTGFGRTGEWFAVDHWRVAPDLMCVGKALAGGFPLSACMGKAEVMDAWRHNSHDAPHSSTFMGHPMGCAAAFAAIGEIEAKGLVQRAREMGVVLGDRLKRLKDKYPIVGDVRNLGLMAGIELVRDRDSKEPATEETRRVVDSALRRGVILTKGGAYGNVLSISPPLVITEEQLCFALDILDEALAAI